MDSNGEEKAGISVELCTSGFTLSLLRCTLYMLENQSLGNPWGSPSRQAMGPPWTGRRLVCVLHV